MNASMENIKKPSPTSMLLSAGAATVDSPQTSGGPLHSSSSLLSVSPKTNKRLGLSSPRSSSHSVSFIEPDNKKEKLPPPPSPSKQQQQKSPSHVGGEDDDDDEPLPPPPPLAPSTLDILLFPASLPPELSPSQLANPCKEDTDVTGTKQPATAVSRTNSSGSIPDYLSHKLHSQINLSMMPNLLKAKRKSIAVFNMRSDRSDQSKDTNSSQHLQQPSVRLVKESCDSSTSTTTSESYHLNDLPSLPAKLATLSKPPNPFFGNSSFRNNPRKARHSIDVRVLPSYLAKKRQSTFGQLLSVISPTAPEESSSSDDPIFAEPIAPTLSLGERVAWVQNSGPEFGVVKWIGRMPQISQDWTVGIEFDNAIGSGDGTVDGRRYFVAKENFAKFLPISELTKVDNYAGRPRSGTMLSRMSVQLKPGQLISIQRSPTAIVPHCYLNAPHHVGHDVHSPNNRHCQCHSCNHPCAHICKTRKPKGKRWTEDMAHMCHFSSKPHASMCCGGEDLATATEPLKEPGVSWKHSEVITSLRTVPAAEITHRKSTIHGLSLHSVKDTSDIIKKSPRQHLHHGHHRQQQQQQQHLDDQQQPPMSETDVERAECSPSNFVNREQLESGLLERTGSDLSISSLPSSSSVAEIYIGRSVLTDESDIDSETERSLESNTKVAHNQANKQGFRSLVACFLANSLRLKSIKLDSNNGNGPSKKKKNKHSDRSHVRRNNNNQYYPGYHHNHPPPPPHLQHPQYPFYHHHPPHQHRPETSALANKSTTAKHQARKNRQAQQLGLSSTDTSYNADYVPNSSVQTSNNNRDHQQTLNSLSSDVIGSSNQVMMNEMNSSSNPNQCTGAFASSPRMVQCHSKMITNFYNPTTKSSPYRINNEMMQQHHIDGHISEEITNSSSSSTQKFTRAESTSDKRTSNYASSENFQSPSRRRKKGPAPKPPKQQQQQRNECSSSPMSNVDPASLNSFAQSLSNSSLTTNCSSKGGQTQQVNTTKSPPQQPPNLVRSLSEQKQINMKNLINALPSFRSEVNLQEVINDDKKDSDDFTANNNKDEQLSIFVNGDHQNHIESIYEIPLSGKDLIQKDIIPLLPEKTFDPLKVFGCVLNVETKRLECRSTVDETSPSLMTRSKSMPFAKYTCCVYHWKEYLATLSTLDEKCHELLLCNKSTSNTENGQTVCQKELYDSPLNDVCDCKNDPSNVISNLTNALLSPKHSVRFKKSDFDLKTQPEQTNDDMAQTDNLLNEMNSFEFIRAMSDGSLTQTNSAATVVEFIHDDESQLDVTKSHGSQEMIATQNVNLKDVFCQTNFKESPEKFSSSRRCKHKQCRCRSMRYRNQRKDCRHQHGCTLHNDCCLQSNVNNNQMYQEKKCSSSNVWLTSSTSDHSLSSLSSSNSTLSETSALRSSNDIISFKNPGVIGSIWTTSNVGKFNKPPSMTANDGAFSKKQQESSDQRSSICSEKLFKSAQNHLIQQQQPIFSTMNHNCCNNKVDFIPSHSGNQSSCTKSKPSSSDFTENNINLTMFYDVPNEFNNKADYAWSRCLMSQLELAIANGDHQKAAILAKELAFKKVNCSLMGKYNSSGQADLISNSSCGNSPVVTYLYIEDRISHKGPIPFQLYPSMTVNMLKIKVEKEFNIPGELQRWIFGKHLALNMNASLFSYGITNSGCPIFLSIKNPNDDDDDDDDVHFGNATQQDNNPLSNETMETNGDLYEKDDDSIYESLQPTLQPQLPPYSSTVQSNKDEIGSVKVNEPAKSRTNQTSINYIQNPLASLDIDAMNNMSSRTSFNENTATISNEPNFSGQTTKNYFYQEEETAPYKNEILLNFVNEMLPRVEEENEDELEEFDEDDDNNETNSQNFPKVFNGQSNRKPMASNQKDNEEFAGCIVNKEPFNCPICFGDFHPGDGVVLRKCSHTFCRICMQNTIEFNEQVQIKCPSCDSILDDVEIKELTTVEIYERYLSRSIMAVEKALDQGLLSFKSINSSGKTC